MDAQARWAASKFGLAVGHMSAGLGEIVLRRRILALDDRSRAARLDEFAVMP